MRTGGGIKWKGIVVREGEEHGVTKEEGSAWTTTWVGVPKTRRATGFGGTKNVRRMRKSVRRERNEKMTSSNQTHK